MSVATKNLLQPQRKVFRKMLRNSNRLRVAKNFQLDSLCCFLFMRFSSIASAKAKSTK